MNLDLNNIHDWRANAWTTYAAESIASKENDCLYRLKFKCNCVGHYRVTLAGNILYQGSQLTTAVAAWESAHKS